MSQGIIVSNIAGNVRAVTERMASAAARAARDADAITLMAVTKTILPDTIKAAAACGISIVGENRIQEAATKIAALDDLSVEWHFIGHLQSNKAKRAVQLFSTIESVDSLDLAVALNRLARDSDTTLRILLEVNTSGEPSKHGFPPTEVERAATKIQSLPALEIEGLMTVGPLTNDVRETRQAFRLLRGLQQQLASRYTETDWETLSMGMTDDFEIAIEEGATLIRVGRAIFGPRL